MLMQYLGLQYLHTLNCKHIQDITKKCLNMVNKCFSSRLNLETAVPGLVLSFQVTLCNAMAKCLY